MSTPPLFSQPESERKRPPYALAGIFGAVVAIVIGIGITAKTTHQPPTLAAGTLLPLAPTRRRCSSAMWR